MTLNLDNEELQLLASLPSAIGSAMAFAGSSGLIGTGKEMFTSAQSLLGGAKEFPDNALIQAIVPDVKATDRSAEMDQAKKTRDWAVARIKAKGIDSPAKLRTQTLEDCRAAAAILASKIGAQEAGEYKRWAMTVAERVAMAATEGGFLGFGGERLSAAERQLLGELQSALGVSAA